ncbi:MAG: hypothetical protein OXL37_16270 [Chloroflexota bacterium]|nr:hypothetical protein [Chloroflexota bacterium]MDE2961439.1 hypothetical protein [Chloroflexota bacterium]
MEFGELKDVDLRDVWPHEAHNFTPWLADNLERLSEVVGIQLESASTEVAVGQFSADILARNPTDGSPVLIENQYGSTDHDHLGKILTYLAGLEARTIIWISERFNDAHLSAVRWLNEHTADQFAFFAVRLRVLQISDSPMVPVFEVLERPSDWDRQVRASAQEENGRLNETRQFRHDFWQFYAQRHPNDIELRPDHIDSNVYHDVSGIVVSQHLSRNRVGIYIRPRTGDDSESSALRVESYWQMLNSGRGEDCLYTNTRERGNWPEMVDWLHDRLMEYRRVLTANATADN